MNIEHKAARILIAIAPFAAAFIPAYLLYRNTHKYLGFPLAASLITAIAAEAIGSSAITIYYKATQHNAYYTAEKNQVKGNRAIWAYVIYLSAVLMVNAILETDIMATIANALLSLLSLSGALLLSVHYQIGEVKERNKKKKNTETVQKKVKEIHEEVKEIQKYNVNSWDMLSDEMKGVLKNGHSINELTEIFPNVTERTLYNWQARARRTS